MDAVGTSGLDIGVRPLALRFVSNSLGLTIELSNDRLKRKRCGLLTNVIKRRHLQYHSMIGVVVRISSIRARWRRSLKGSVRSLSLSSLLSVLPIADSISLERI